MLVEACNYVRGDLVRCEVESGIITVQRHSEACCWKSVFAIEWGNAIVATMLICLSGFSFLMYLAFSVIFSGQLPAHVGTYP